MSNISVKDKMQLDEYVDDFNSLLKDFADNLAYVSPNSIIGRNIKDIHRTMKIAKSKETFIDVFVDRVLQYKDQIDEGNEKFFLDKKSYKDELEGNKFLASKVFEFKNLWKELNKQNRDMMLQYLRLLCKLAQEYFCLKDKLHMFD